MRSTKLIFDKINFKACPSFTYGIILNCKHVNFSYWKQTLIPLTSLNKKVLFISETKTHNKYLHQLFEISFSVVFNTIIHISSLNKIVQLFNCKMINKKIKFSIIFLSKLVIQLNVNLLPITIQRIVLRTLV
jgi:hypothetical protein